MRPALTAKRIAALTPHSTPSSEFIAAARPERLLDERARRLSSRRTVDEAERGTDALVCRIGTDLYGVDARSVAGIIPMLETTAVPQASKAMIGLFGRSGRVFSAFDLGVALGLAPADMRAGHLVLMRHTQARIAMRVDRAVALMNLIVDPDPSAPTPVSRELVLGYARPTGKDPSTQLGHIALLDSDRLMSQFVSSFRPSGV